eukprot:Hpha_TRINITY_DN12253_c0_g1::TRINITY_DN12253_c0_g1_i2::g.16931::m.16931
MALRGSVDLAPPPRPGGSCRESQVDCVEMHTAICFEDQSDQGLQSPPDLQAGDLQARDCSPLGQMIVGSDSFTLEMDDRFALLRRRLRIPDDFMKGNFDFAKMAAGGGKGGACMARSKCGQWWIKELAGGDLEALNSPGFLRAYVEHLTAEGGRSMLCKIVALFRRPMPEGEPQRLIIMSNCMPHPDATWGHRNRDGGWGWTYLLDLKGNRDDKLMMQHGARVEQVHKRCWKCNWLLGECIGCPGLCCVSHERQVYQRGKDDAFNMQFHLTPPDAGLLKAVVDDDVRFLRDRNLMDYSAIVGVVELPPGAIPPRPKRKKGEHFAPPFVCQVRNKTYAYYWGIIDFLQLWNCGKKTAHVIKTVFAPKPISTVNPTIYADQFMTLVHQRLRANGKPLPLLIGVPSPSGSAVPQNHYDPQLSPHRESEPVFQEDPPPSRTSPRRQDMK